MKKILPLLTITLLSLAGCTLQRTMIRDNYHQVKDLADKGDLRLQIEQTFADGNQLIFTDKENTIKLTDDTSEIKFSVKNTDSSYATMIFIDGTENGNTDAGRIDHFSTSVLNPDASASQTSLGQHEAKVIQYDQADAHNNITKGNVVFVHTVTYTITKDD